MPLDSPLARTSDQILQTDFYIPSRGKGSVTFTVHADDDPKQYGMDLLFPSYALSDFKGYPACEGTVKSEQSGYASMYGWIQLVRDCNTTLDDHTPWQMDPIPISENTGWPFAWFGPNASLFDAPARVGVSEIDWAARCFFTYIDDCLLTRNVRPIVRFEWGFSIRGGVISIKEAKQLDTDQWNRHIPFLSLKFPGWTFAAATSDKEEPKSG